MSSFTDIGQYTGYLTDIGQYTGYRPPGVVGAIIKFKYLAHSLGSVV